MDGRLLVTDGGYCGHDHRERELLVRSRKAWLLDPYTGEWTTLPQSPVCLFRYYSGVVGGTAHFIGGETHVTYRQGRGWEMEPIEDKDLLYKSHDQSKALVVGQFLVMRRRYRGVEAEGAAPTHLIELVAFDTISGEVEVWESNLDEEKHEYRESVMYSHDTAIVTGNGRLYVLSFDESLLYPDSELEWGINSARRRSFDMVSDADLDQME
ncbi:hypothetical protein KIPB_005238 [Kipferlia bialata]|uniref:Kelch-type beta propeller n=1 Tax=Kipferlia bialata TaxID=797122 RepID=A0A391NL41_9EUKA|nr:hypothetical protein KIPB_005238 [Kipferlia bialata]|eukprot:g5238.t1